MISTAERLLAAQGHVSFLELLIALNWLSPNAEQAWRKGRIEFLAGDIRGGGGDLVLKLFQKWGAGKGLEQRKASYTRPGRTGSVQLHIFPPGNDDREALFRTVYVVASKKAVLEKKEAKPPQPVVFSIVRDSSGASTSYFFALGSPVGGGA